MTEGARPGPVDDGISPNVVLPAGGVMVSEKIQLTIEAGAALRPQE